MSAGGRQSWSWREGCCGKRFREYWGSLERGRSLEDRSSGGALPRVLGIARAGEDRSSGGSASASTGDRSSGGGGRSLERGDAPSTLFPRTQSYIAAGTSLQRARNCGGSDTFDNQYRVRTQRDNVFLDVRQDGLLFTFQQR